MKSTKPSDSCILVKFPPAVLLPASADLKALMAILINGQTVSEVVSVNIDGRREYHGDSVSYKDGSALPIITPMGTIFPNREAAEEAKAEIVRAELANIEAERAKREAERVERADAAPGETSTGRPLTA